MVASRYAESGCLAVLIRKDLWKIVNYTLGKREKMPVFRWENVKNPEKFQRISFFHGACAAGPEQKLVEIS